MATFEESLQFLRKESSDGVSLYDHLSEVLLKVLAERPEDASSAFEHISAGVKELRASPAPKVPSISREAEKAAQLKWATEAQALLKEPEEPTEGGPTPPNVVEQANLWSLAGVSFGQLETFRIHLAVNQLAASLPGEHLQLRFWGRISTRGASDYLIVEGRALDDQLGEFEEATMEGTAGGNRYTYWVCSGAGTEWVQLPPVTQAQIVAARHIKRYFTGNLKAFVPGYPPFPGAEQELLRAQIARITSSTAVSPAGFFQLDEDSDAPSINLAESEAINEAFPKASEELNSLDAWVHHEQEVNILGRVLPMPERTDENGDPVEEDDPPEDIAPLRSLSEDKEGTWGLRLCPAGAAASPSSAVAVKSLLWPGAYAVAAGTQFTNIYVGDGTKFQSKPYQFPHMPAIQTEWAPAEDEEGLTEASDVLVDPNPPEEEEGEPEE